MFHKHMILSKEEQNSQMMYTYIFSHYIADVLLLLYIRLNSFSLFSVLKPLQSCFEHQHDGE